ncbi:MAG: hypothetical protein PHY31_06635, partial [Smithellaceae bacterium]|nr:hypothetical protein [Smithellaceae bacterium]
MGSGTDNVVIEFLNGERHEAALLSPFQTDDNEIEVIIDGGKESKRISLAEISCIQMNPPAGKVENLFYGKTIEETIKTKSGSSFRVLVDENHRRNGGFFGLNVDPESPYKFIYFTADNPVGAGAERRKGVRAGVLTTSLRIGDILVEEGLVTREQADAALEISRNDRKRLGTVLIEQGIVTEDQLLMALAKKFRLRMVNLENAVPDQEALSYLSVDLAKKLEVIPIAVRDNVLVVATSHPTDYSVQDTLRFHTNRKIEMVIATAAQIKNAIDAFYTPQQVPEDDLVSELTLYKNLYTYDIGVEEESKEEDVSESDSKVVAMVNKILVDA